MKKRSQKRKKKYKKGDPKVDFYETGFTLSQWSSLTKEDKKKAKEIFKKKVESKEWEGYQNGWWGSSF